MDVHEFICKDVALGYLFLYKNNETKMELRVYFLGVPDSGSRKAIFGLALAGHFCFVKSVKSTTSQYFR